MALPAALARGRDRAGPRAGSGAAFLVGRTRAVDGPAPCSGGDAEIAAAWPRDARAAQLARIAGLGAYGGELARRVANQVDEHAASWAAQHRDACLAHRRGVQSDALLDRRVACLSRARGTLAAFAEIAGAADAAALPDLARAAASLPDPAACADGGALDGAEAPPPALAPRVARLRDDLSRARVQLAAGRANAARDAARAAAAELRRVGYRPLLAEALLIEGSATRRTDPPAALAALEAATAAAIASHLDAIAVEAWARRAWIDGMGGRAETALAGLNVIDALAARSPSAAFARALLHNNAGTVELNRGRRAEARAAFEKALELARGVTGPGSVELTSIRTNLALVTDDAEQRDRLAGAVHDELARLLGETHPDALMARYKRAGTSVTRLDTSGDMFAATCEHFAMHEQLAPLIAPCFVELADVREELGDRAAALAAYERAADGAEEEVLEAPGYVALWRGDPAEAVRRFEAALANRPDEPSDAGERFVRAKLHLGHGRALRAAGRPGPAAAALERSLDALGALDTGVPVVQRRRARARAELAELLAASGGPPARIRELADQAGAWYRAAGAPPTRLTALAALTRGYR